LVTVPTGGTDLDKEGRMASKQSAALMELYRAWSTVPAADHERPIVDWDAIAHPAGWSRPGLAA
jgi:hypothetical protein